MTRPPDVLSCAYCDSPTNRRAGVVSVASGVDRWVCSTCGALRYWAPCCNQGWLVKSHNRATGEQRYVCEECETVFSLDWRVESGIASLGDWLGKVSPLWTDFDQIRENTVERPTEGDRPRINGSP